MGKILVLKTLFKTYKFESIKFSYDSHENGYFKVHDVEGKVFFMLPYNKVKSVQIKEVK